jgi:hypothetical protein
MGHREVGRRQFFFNRIYRLCCERKNGRARAEEKHGSVEIPPVEARIV